MNQIDQLHEIVATYLKFGWSVRRVLLTPATAGSASESEAALFAGAIVKDSTIDAVWFSRPSHEKREAWELRLVSETPYALLEIFESDETEEQRADLLLEMEARMRGHVGKD